MFSCDTCDQQFSSERNLNRHAAMHKNTKPNVCTQCAFSSKRKDSLKRHYDLYHQREGDDIEGGSAAISSNDGKKFDGPKQLSCKNDDYFDSSSFDTRLQLPHNFIYAGASQSGKTTLLMKTLENASRMYNPVPTRIFFYYSCFQQNYTTLKNQLASQGIECLFREASVITEHDLERMADPNGGQTLIIIDDNSIAAASSKEMAQVFTVARHKNCSIVLLLHFIFGPWPSSRIISANTSYFFLLKSPRMKPQISTFGAQLGRQKGLLAAYDRETSKTYGYVLVDLCTETPEDLRMRSDILNENGCNGSNESIGVRGNTMRQATKRKNQSTQTDEDVPLKKTKLVFRPWP